MAGTIIADYIRADANKISLNVGNTVVASINASGILSNTGSVIVNVNGQIPNTAISGTLTQSQIGTGVAGTGPVLVVCRQTTNQAFTSGTYNLCQFNSVITDTISCWDSVNYRYTPNVAGWYFLTGQFQSGGAADPTRTIMHFWVNGTNSSLHAKQTWDIPTTLYAAAASAMVYLNGSTDYVDFRIYVSGSNVALTGGTDGFARQSYMTAVLMRAA
jgi:hypothetical protein